MSDNYQKPAEALAVFSSVSVAESAGTDCIVGGDNVDVVVVVVVVAVVVVVHVVFAHIVVAAAADDDDEDVPIGAAHLVVAVVVHIVVHDAVLVVVVYSQIIVGVLTVFELPAVSVVAPTKYKIACFRVILLI